MKIKDIMVTIREFCLIVAFVLLLIFPNWINNRLMDAGFTKIDFGVAEWEKTIQESQKEVEDAVQANAEAQVSLDKISNTLAQISRSPQSTNNSAMQRQVLDLRREIQASSTRLDSSQIELQKSLVNHKVLLNKVQLKQKIQ
ncbi:MULTISPECIES: hypothetical protein [Flavobacteriaceae]|uniref:hypothetical protein n=1 Tax=Flavobacteriaceae TaxID=49546 RepID=UPI001492B08A|nr:MULTISPECIES: hypothetical protein [Allomuricauda]MDC6364710.1 hypothetical protein [Muricauda sp. AC10]